ncbi:MAG: HAD hydrolase-like protein, partial [Candidatus Liptonbacteria bacterium]|nr:HAD hydrolase-like protein [Candidatus Liptonbacteria bacterium]
KKYKINMKGSFVVGDSTRDMLAGKRAKLKTILVETGYAGQDKAYKVKPDYVAKNLRDAVKIIEKFSKK